MGGDVLRLGVELHRRQPDLGVRRDQPGAVGRGDPGHKGKLLDPAQHLVDGSRDLRRVQGAALRLHHDLVTIAALRWKVRFHDVERPARIGRGKREVVGVARPCGPRDSANQDQRNQPGRQHDLPMPETPARQCGHQGTFLSGGGRAAASNTAAPCPVSHTPSATWRAPGTPSAHPLAIMSAASAGESCTSHAFLREIPYNQSRRIGNRFCDRFSPGACASLFPTAPKVNPPDRSRSALPPPHT